MNDEIAARLKQARAHLGMSQRAMAEALEVSPTTYSSWEVSRTVPNAIALRKLCAMGFDGHWLVTGEGEMLRVKHLGVQVPPHPAAPAPRPPAVRQPPAPLDEDVTATLLRELKSSHLGEILLMSRRGTQLGQWRVLQLLCRRSERGMTVDELFALLSQDDDAVSRADIAADCQLLLRSKLIEVSGPEEERRYRVRDTQVLRAGPQADRLQGVLEAVRFLTEVIAPDVWMEGNRSQLYEITLTTPDGAAFMERIRTVVLEEGQAAETDRGDDVRILLGMVKPVDGGR